MAERKERKLGIKGYIKPTKERLKRDRRTEKLRERKALLGIECLWTSAGNPNSVVMKMTDSELTIESK